VLPLRPDDRSRLEAGQQGGTERARFECAEEQKSSGQCQRDVAAAKSATIGGPGPVRAQRPWLLVVVERLALCGFAERWTRRRPCGPRQRFEHSSLNPPPY
jgi:hypothetical protein